MKHYARIMALCVVLTGMGLLGTVVAAQTDRWQALRDDPAIENGVLVIAIGDTIVDHCPTLAARRMPVLGYMMDLANRARDMGYNRAEIVAYVEDDREKERVRARALQWLQQRGADPREPQSICDLGRDEISSGSTIGRLLQEG